MRVIAPGRKGWSVASSISRMITATSAASTTHLCRSACLNMWVWTIIRCSAPWQKKHCANTVAGLIHSIGRNRPGTMSAWIERRIFPGAHPPCLSEMMQIFEPNNFSVLDVENLRLHYARTLAHWLERFEANADKIEAMTDPAFVRAWRLYLAGSMASFTAGDLQLFQVVFSNGTCNDVPWTRWRLYNDTRSNKEKIWNPVTS